jgi:hypothetical protein
LSQYTSYFSLRGREFDPHWGLRPKSFRSPLFLFFPIICFLLFH